MREADIRPAAILNEYLRLSAADAENFFADRSHRTHRACPGCEADRPEPAFEKNGFDLVRCRDCATLYVNPVPAGEGIDDFYRDSPSANYWANVFFPTVAEPRRRHIFRPRAERISEIAAELGHPLRRLTDVGAGTGIFLEEFGKLAPEAELRAIEPGKELADACRKKNIATFEGFVEDAAMTDWRDGADLVTCFEVIEHVPAIGTFVRALAALAAPGGIVLVSGLCGDGFDIQVLGSRANAVSPPHHLNFLSRRGAEALTRRCGLELIEFSTPGRLDVDIVLNALKEDPEAVADPELRAFLSDADAAARAEFQHRLSAEGKSSHMWLLARRPADGAC